MFRIRIRISGHPREKKVTPLVSSTRLVFLIASRRMCAFVSHDKSQTIHAKQTASSGITVKRSLNRMFFFVFSYQHGAAAGMPRMAAGVGVAPAPARQAAERQALATVPRLRPQPHQARVQPRLHQVQDRAAGLVSSAPVAAGLTSSASVAVGLMSSASVAAGLTSSTPVAAGLTSRAPVAAGSTSSAPVAASE